MSTLGSAITEPHFSRAHLKAVSPSSAPRGLNSLLVLCVDSASCRKLSLDSEGEDQAVACARVKVQNARLNEVRSGSISVPQRDPVWEESSGPHCERKTLGDPVAYGHGWRERSPFSETTNSGGERELAQR